MGMLKLKKGAYLAIANDERWLEVHANSKKEARDLAKAAWNTYPGAGGPAKSIRVTPIPEMIFVVD